MGWPLVGKLSLCNAGTRPARDPTVCPQPLGSPARLVTDPQRLPAWCHAPVATEQSQLVLLALVVPSRGGGGRRVLWDGDLPPPGGHLPSAGLRLLSRGCTGRRGGAGDGERGKG